MGAPKGNQYWKLRKKSGRNPLYTDPEKLRSDINDYFTYIKENPLKEEVVSGGKIMTVNKMRPYTLQGLSVWLGMDYQTFLDYGEKKDFSEIITHARNVCYAQKLEGAAAGFFNSSIIARDLKLVDRRDITSDEAPLVSDIKVEIVQPDE